MAFNIADLIAAYTQQMSNGSPIDQNTYQSSSPISQAMGQRMSLQAPPAVVPLDVTTVQQNTPPQQTPVGSATVAQTNPQTSQGSTALPFGAPLPAEDAAAYARMFPGQQRQQVNQGQSQQTSNDLGILDRVGGALNNYFRPQDPDFISRIGNALSVAGSQDPFKALMMLRQQQAEDDKLRQARRKAMEPKVDQINGTPFYQITQPDGSVKLVTSPELEKFYKNKDETSLAGKVEMAVVNDRLANSRDATKATEAERKARLESDLKAQRDAKEVASKASEAAIPILNDVKSLSERWKEAQKIVSTQGTSAQIQGIPGIAGIAGFFGGDEVAKNKFLEGLTVDETLLNTARTKGAISNQEMTLFKSPIPSVTDDREKVWKPWIEKRLEVLNKLEKFYEGQVARSTPSSISAQSNEPVASPQRNAAIEAQLKASGKAYDPNTYEYRIGPNGEVQARKK